MIVKEVQPSMNSIGSEMKIAVVSGIGCGSTELSSFDDALRVCGAMNFNVIPLLSVIPPAAQVLNQSRYCPNGEDYGHRLYVVKAEARSTQPGEIVGAGIGWHQWGDGRGVFVEHETIGTSRDDVSGHLIR